jgi:hypothetical protein
MILYFNNNVINADIPSIGKSNSLVITRCAMKLSWILNVVSWMRLLLRQ